MQSVDYIGLEKLDEDLQKLLDEIPEARRTMHERIAKTLQDEVRAEVDASGINDKSGKIKSWQEARVGSGGGYAAVSAAKGKTGPNSPGAITNYLENGHRIRQPSGKSKRYRPNIKKPYVDGYHFYQRVRSRAEAIAISEAEKYADEIARKLEG